jgi:hypothetical protein
MARSKSRKALDRPEPFVGVIARAGENRYARKRPAVPDHLWAQAVGLRIAERARPLGLERGVLTVRAATSVWANELSLLSATLIERLRALGVEVNELRFRVGPLTPQPVPMETRKTRKVPPPAALPPEVAESLQRIADDELREAVAGAVKANLAWQNGEK